MNFELEEKLSAVILRQTVTEQTGANAHIYYQGIHLTEIIMTSHHRALYLAKICINKTCTWPPSYIRLTNCHPGKNIREVLLKPLPTFGRLGHVLAILCTKQYRISRSFTTKTSYLCINMLIIDISLRIYTHLCRQ